MVFYAPDVNARKGDTVETSGLLRRLPAGLFIGTLAEDTSVCREPNTREALLTLTVNRMQLSELLIVERVGE